nr:hypothetical protein [Bradyrhizobium sp.]
MLRFKPLNLDALPLNIVLTAAFPSSGSCCDGATR